MKYGAQFSKDGSITKIPVIDGSKKDYKELANLVSKKEQVSKILTRLQTINQKLVGNKDGTLNLEKFNKQPEVIEAIKKLKKIKITKDWLFENGFMSAGMILFFGETKKKAGA